MRQSRPLAVAMASAMGVAATVAALLSPSAAAADASVVHPPGSIEIPFAYHSQQTGDWCDPADIEMWLQATGATLPAGGDHSVQQTFWNYETSHNDGYTVAEWNASPFAVAVTVDRFGGYDDVGDAPQPSLEAAGAVIARSIAMLHQPVIVMVGGATHYVLVTGAQLGPDGVDGAPLAVTLADPLQFGVSGSPPAGSDGAVTMSWSDFASWYTPDTHHGGVWADRWVLVAAGISLVG